MELAGLEIEVSLLGPLEPIASPDDIEVGRHGLLVERDWQRGLLLPQVATEWRWDRETFLAQTCHKAGLPRDAWKQGARVWRFEAEVFGDLFTTMDTKDTEENMNRFILMSFVSSVVRSIPVRCRGSFHRSGQSRSLKAIGLPLSAFRAASAALRIDDR